MGVVKSVHMGHITVKTLDPSPLEFLKHQRIEIDDQSLAKNAAVYAFRLQLHLVENGAGLAKTTEKHNRVRPLLLSHVGRRISTGRKAYFLQQPGELALDFVIVSDEIVDRTEVIAKTKVRVPTNSGLMCLKLSRYSIDSTDHNR